MKKKKETLEDALSRNADEMVKAEKKKSKKKKKKRRVGKTIWLVICIILIVIVIAVISYMAGAGGAKEVGKKVYQTAQQIEDNDNAGDSSATEHFETDLSSGHYVAGVDIPAGTYNLTATSGNGNVNSSNMYSGGLNEIMGTPADDLYIETFNNLQLPEGETLSLTGTVTLHIVSDNAHTGSMTERTVDDEVQTDLSSGNYVAGTDFPAGVYNIISTGNSGNVNSDNMYEGGLNEILGDGSDGYSVKQVNNVELPEGTTLTISGTSIQLLPVGSAK